MMTGFILAGGQSSRMGRDKAFLSVGGRMLIEHVMERVRPHVHRLIAIGHQDNRERLRQLGFDDVLSDVQPGRGPLMGVYTGLLETETPLNLFISCDMPWISGCTIQQLAAVCGSGSPAAASRGPEGRFYPLPMLCHVRVGRAAGALLDRHEQSLHRFLECVNAGVVPVDAGAEQSAFTNVNTVADYVRLCDVRGGGA